MPDFRVGALVPRGYNPGGAIDVIALIGFEYDEESLWNFEVFTPASVLDKRVQLSTSAFHTRIKDCQIFTNAMVPGFEFLGPQGKIENADRIVTYGLDSSASAQVMDDLGISSSLCPLKTGMKQFDASSDVVVSNSQPRAPTVTFSIGAQYDVTDQLSVGGDVRYVHTYYGGALNTGATKAGNFVVVDLNVAFRVNDYFQIVGAANNLFNKYYTVQASGTGAGRGVGFGDPLEFTVGEKRRC